MMKKLLCVLLTVSFLLGVCGSLAEVKWTFPVSLLEGESEFALLVNKEHLLDAGFIPKPMINFKVKTFKYTPNTQFQETAYNALLEMLEAALKVTEMTYVTEEGSTRTATFEEGMRLMIKSGYRSYSTQNIMYSNRLQSQGRDDGVVQAPGASEHQTGLCADILSVEYNADNSTMKEDFQWTPEAQWLKAHCSDFGFILRYPDDKEEITGIIFEPWHFRYVGKTMAGYIMANGLCLEEFTEEFEAAKAEFVENGGDLDAERALELERLTALPESIVLDVCGEDGDYEVTLEI